MSCGCHGPVHAGGPFHDNVKPQKSTRWCTKPQQCLVHSHRSAGWLVLGCHISKGKTIQRSRVRHEVKRSHQASCRQDCALALPKDWRRFNEPRELRVGTRARCCDSAPHGGQTRGGWTSAQRFGPGSAVSPLRGRTRLFSIAKLRISMEIRPRLHFLTVKLDSRHGRCPPRVSHRPGAPHCHT